MIIANKYKILEQIGQGSFGKVFKGENIRTKELVAIKIEKNVSGFSSLKYETQIYQAISQTQTRSKPSKGIPSIKWFGLITDYYFMVLPLFGPSLEKLKKDKSVYFSLKTTLVFGIQMIQRLQSIHEKGFIHRDIKPDNFLLDSDTSKSDTTPLLYLVDFGFCRRYIKDGKHIPIKLDRELIGSPKFVSGNIHNRIEPSRRDDLESVGNIMMYLLHDSFIINEKINNYLNYCKQLAFEQTPDYDYLYSILLEK